MALATAVIAASSAWVLFRGIDRAPFHGDEAGWISSGIYYSDLVFAGDFSREKWDCAGCKSWGALNGHVGKLLIGAAYLTCDESHPCAFNGYYDFFTSFDENRQRGQVPPESVLRRGRSSAAIAGVICCLLAFAIGYMAGEPKLVLGILCSGLVLGAPLFRLFANRAMTDAFYNLFLLTQLLAAIVIVQSGDERKLVRRFAIAGMLTGLTASVKASGFVLGVPLFTGVAAYRLGVGQGYKRPENGRLFFVSVATFLITALVVIYALNPTFWPSGLSDMWRLLGFPQVLLAWDRYMAFEDVSLGLGEWTGNHFADIHRSIFLKYSSAGINILFVLGLLSCARRWLISTRRGVADVSFVPLAYFLCNYGLLIAFLRLNWDRYYLPVEISMRLIAAIGIAGLAVNLSQRVASARSSRPAITEVSR